MLQAPIIKYCALLKLFNNINYHDAIWILKDALVSYCSIVTN